MSKFVNFPIDSGNIVNALQPFNISVSKFVNFPIDSGNTVILRSTIISVSNTLNCVVIIFIALFISVLLLISLNSINLHLTLLGLSFELVYSFIKSLMLCDVMNICVSLNSDCGTLAAPPLCVLYCFNCVLACLFLCVLYLRCARCLSECLTLRLLLVIVFIIVIVNIENVL